MPKYLKVFIASIFLTLIMTGPAVAGSTASTTAATSVAGQNTHKPSLERQNAQAKKDIQEETAEKRKEITSEALAAIEATEHALQALNKGKKKEAISALEGATGKLELILAREPDLALAPVDVSLETYDLFGADIEKVKDARKGAQRLLDEGRVQAARQLLSNLASETVIRVSNIPLATYPDAIKRAVKLVDEGKGDDAKSVLEVALNTLVVTEKIIPLPVVDAKVFLKEAEKLAEKSDRTRDENERLNRALGEARSQLEFGQALGYGSERDFKSLYAQIDEIEERTSGGKHGRGFFTKITSLLQELTDSAQPKAHRQPASHPAVNK
jgi:hypothetical protein